MNIEFALLQIDNEVTGFELGELRLMHDGKNISSENRFPSQSVMIFIFLSNLLDELRGLRATKRNSWCIATSANSAFALYLEKKDKNILIRNAATTMNLPFDKFSEILYSSIKSWLLNWQPVMDPQDGALCDLLQSMDRFAMVFNLKT